MQAIGGQHQRKGCGSIIGWLCGSAVIFIAFTLYSLRLFVWWRSWLVCVTCMCGDQAKFRYM